MLGFLPGLLHAWYIIAKYPDPYIAVNNADDAEGGNVTYYYVAHRVPPPEHRREHDRAYGTTDTNATASRHREDGPSAQGQGVPPSYEQAIKGDYKVQTGD